MAGATVTAVVVLGVPGQKLPHDGGYALRAASKKEGAGVLSMRTQA